MNRIKFFRPSRMLSFLPSVLEETIVHPVNSEEKNFHSSIKELITFERISLMLVTFIIQ